MGSFPDLTSYVHLFTLPRRVASKTSPMIHFEYLRGEAVKVELLSTFAFTRDFS